MNKNYKNILFLIIFLCFLSMAGFTYAALEITYPKIPFYPDINNCAGQDCMAKFISYWFGFGIMLAGAIALISLVIASVQLIASAGNTGMQSDAKDRIKGALLGMVLLLSSFIIMRTINPSLVAPALTPLGEVAGVFYTNGTEAKPAPISESDTANIPEGFQTIVYKCADGAYSPTLFVWMFQNKNFDYTGGVDVREVDCGQQAGTTGYGSFKMAFKTPGVYYFLGANCSGYMSGPVLSDEAQIADPFKGNIKSIKIVNGDGFVGGFVVHSDIDFRGECDDAHFEMENVGCSKVNISASSINIFRWNGDVKASGNGVTFYSEPFGKEARTPGAKSGFYNLGFEQISKNIRFGMWSDTPDKIDFSQSYDLIGASSEYRIECPDFGQCPGSIKIQGNYATIFYTGYPNEEGDTDTYYCQVFREDAPNLNGEEFMGEGRDLIWVNVIPIK